MRPMHLHAVHLQYFMPQQQEASDHLQDSAACCSSTSPAATMWEYRQPHAALQPSPSWSPYAGATAALLAAGTTFPADSSSPPPADMSLPAGELHAHGHPWSHGELSNGTRYMENFLDLLASNNVTPEMLEVEDHSSVAAGRYVMPPFKARFEDASGSVDTSTMKYEIAGAGSPLFLGSATTGVLQVQGMRNTMSCMSCYVDHHHQPKDDGCDHHQQQQELANPMASFLHHVGTGGMQTGGLDYPGLGSGGLDKICQDDRAMEASAFSVRSLPDFGSFGGYRSTAEPTSVQTYMRSADTPDSSRQEQAIVSARNSSRGGSGVVTDGKNRRSEERKEGAVKKIKKEASPPKQQVPKVKLGEKITALQQIVSPFGKTDTASVLFETIKYIKFLHEQVQLLSEPYTNASRNKAAGTGSNSVPWGDLREEARTEGGAEHDLRDRGLCLVPVSWTPEVYRDGNAMDYWTPAYRGCLYR